MRSNYNIFFFNKNYAKLFFAILKILNASASTIIGPLKAFIISSNFFVLKLFPKPGPITKTSFFLNQSC